MVRLHVLDGFDGQRGDFYKNMFATCPAGRPCTADEAENEGGSKVRLALFLFVLLMESGSKYSILKEEKFLFGRLVLHL